MISRLFGQAFVDRYSQERSRHRLRPRLLFTTPSTDRHPLVATRSSVAVMREIIEVFDQPGVVVTMTATEP